MRTRNLLVICVTVLVFAFVLWPGLYHYGQYSLGRGVVVPMRTNRITGNVQFLVNDKWTSENQKSEPATEDIPPEEVNKITGRGNFMYGQSFSAELYNGSSWTITEIEYEITTRGPLRLEDFGTPLPGVGGRRKVPEDIVKKAKEKPEEFTPVEDCTPWTRRFRNSTYILPFSTGSEYFSVGGGVDKCNIEWRIVSARGVKQQSR